MKGEIVLTVFSIDYLTGQGEIDSYLIQNCTPKLDHYIGLEPDMFRFNKLSSCISGSKNLEVCFVGLSMN